jgi:hypothetical protein
MNNNEDITIEDIKQEIEAYIEEVGQQNFFSKRNDNGNHCCYLCDALIGDMDFKCISIGRYEWERGIEFLVCGINCPYVSDDLKCRCSWCGDVVDIGYYRDFPREMKCEYCEIMPVAH